MAELSRPPYQSRSPRADSTVSGLKVVTGEGWVYKEEKSQESGGQGWGVKCKL